MNELISRITKAQTLDELWHEAEQLGRISVDKSWGKNAYEVVIRFDTRGGSAVSAKGTDTNIAFAVAKAINEARELGAGSAA